MSFITLDDIWDDFLMRVGVEHSGDFAHPANKSMFTTGAVAALSYLATASGPDEAIDRLQELMTAIENTTKIQLEELKKAPDCYDGSAQI